MIHSKWMSAVKRDDSAVWLLSSGGCAGLGCCPAALVGRAMEKQGYEERVR